MSQLATFPKNDKQILRAITVISVVVPVLVGVLLFMPYKISLSTELVRFLPKLNAIINSLTSVLLVAGLYFILKGKAELHKKAMLAAVALGAVFLVSYVLYHSSATSVKYGDVNGDMVVDASEKLAVASSSGFYYFILLTHIVLAAIVLPFVLLAVFFALSGKLVNHKRIVKWAYPIWLYVSVTGVVVYLMISPFYQ